MDADALVHEALAPKGRGHRAVVQWLGPSVLKPDGTLDRVFLADRVFRNFKTRRKLESLLHPLVRGQFQKRIAGHRTGLLVLDVPLLFEAGFNKMVDKTVVVWAPQKERLRRLFQGRGMSRNDALRRLAAQWPLVQKRRLADEVIDNSGSAQDLEKNVECFLRKIEIP